MIAKMTRYNGQYRVSIISALFATNVSTRFKTLPRRQRLDQIKYKPCHT